MYSYSWINGQFRQPSSHAAPLLTQDSTTKRQTETEKPPWHYRTTNTDVRPAPSTHLTSRNGAFFDKWTSDWQIATVHHHAQKRTNNDHERKSHGNLQNSRNHLHCGNSPPVAMRGPQVAHPKDLHLYNSAYRSQSDPRNANTVSAQSAPVYRKQSTKPHDSYCLPETQLRWTQNGMCQNANGESTQPVLAHSSAGTLLSQMVGPGTTVSPTAYNLQTASQYHRQKSSQHGFPPPDAPPSYIETVSQAYRRDTLKPPSGGQTLHVSSMNQKPQQYSAPPVSASNSRVPTSGNSNSYCCRYETRGFSSKTNELPLNPAGDKQHQMLGCKMNARLADSQYKPFTTGLNSPLNTSPTYHGKTFDSDARVTHSNQSVPPVTSAVMKSYNQNMFQSSSLHFDLSPLKTSQNLVSSEDGSGHAVLANSSFFLRNNSKEAQAGSVSDSPQLIQGLDSNSSKRNEAQSFTESGLQLLEKLIVRSNDGSISSSPGRLAPRVAVVQPMSQERYEVAIKHRGNEHAIPGDAMEAVVSNKLSNLLHSPNQVTSNKSMISCLAASSHGIAMSPSDPATPQFSPQKRLCSDDTGNKQTVNMQVDHHVSFSVQQSVTSEVSESQSGDKDKSEMPQDPKTDVFELSSIPTTQWTTEKIMKLALDAEKGQLMPDMFTEIDLKSKLLNMFWCGSYKMLLSVLKRGWYKDLITDVQEFCGRNLTADCVVLLQVEDAYKKQLDRFHVLRDDEFVSEVPYTSSWLNINEQLDDIDKEFGFLWPLKHHPHVLESGSLPDQVNNIPADTVNQVPKELSQVELEPVDSDNEKQASTVEVISEEAAASPKITDGADSNDPYYSFEIQVFSPEEAKVIFRQAQAMMPQSIEPVCHQERDARCSVEGDLLDKDVTKESDPKKKTGALMEQFCCIERWIETILNASSLSKCQCKKEQNHFPDMNPEKETAEQSKHKQTAAKLESKFHSMMEGDNQTRDEENVIEQIPTFSLSELSSQTTNLTNEKEIDNISQRSVNCSQSGLISRSKSEDEKLSCSESELANQIQVLEMECGQAQLKATESSQSTRKDSIVKDLKNIFTGECKVANQTSKDDDCGQTQLKSPDVAEPPLKTGGRIQVNAKADNHTTHSFGGNEENFKRNRKRCHGLDRVPTPAKKPKKYKPLVNIGSQQINKGVSKCWKVSVAGTDAEPLVSDVRTVELALFGSTSQERSGLKAHRSSDEGTRPPKVLSVSVRRPRRKLSESVPKENDSAKRRILEKKWSLSPTRIEYRSKLKTPNTLSAERQKKAERSSPSSNKELSVSTDDVIRERKAQSFLSRKRRRSLSIGLKHGQKDVFTPKQPAALERRNSENGNLKLRIKATTDSVSHKPGLQSKEKRPRLSLKHWLTDNPAKQLSALQPSCVPKSSSVFHEYQKKYMKKMQPFTD